MKGPFPSNEPFAALSAGLDIAKNVFQVHGIDAPERQLMLHRKRDLLMLERTQVIQCLGALFCRLPLIW